MYKKASLFVLASLIVLSVVNFNPVSRIFVNEPLSKEEPEIYVAVNNPTDSDFSNTKVRAYIEDMGIFLHSIPFDLKHKETVLKRMQGSLPDIEPGEYYMRVVVSGKIRNVNYVPVIVG